MENDLKFELSRYGIHWEQAKDIIDELGGNIISVWQPKGINAYALNIGGRNILRDGGFNDNSRFNFRDTVIGAIVGSVITIVFETIKSFFIK